MSIPSFYASTSHSNGLFFQLSFFPLEIHCLDIEIYADAVPYKWRNQTQHSYYGSAYFVFFEGCLVLLSMYSYCVHYVNHINMMCFFFRSQKIATNYDTNRVLSVEPRGSL